MSRIKALLVDLDGTLVDSKEADVLASLEALRRRGFMVSRESLEPLFGFRDEEIYRRVLGITDDNLLRFLVKEKLKLFFDKYILKVKPMSGARELLRYAKSQGLKICVVTSSDRELALRELIVTSLLSYIGLMVTADMVKRSKPSPEPILKALSLLELRAEEVVYMGDTALDLEAAMAAGVKYVIVLDHDNIESRQRNFMKARDLHEALAILKELLNTS